MPERSQAHDAVVDLIVDRWSPRSFDGSPVPQADLEIMFEAGGWAPSAYNEQPWTFLYARNGDAHWDDFLSCLVEFNQSWAKTSGALVYIVSKRTMGEGDDRKDSHTHSFDAGAAWALLALQATHMGYHTHGMIGVDLDKAARTLALPASHRIECVVAIGKQDAKDKLPEALQAREVPSGRKDVSETSFNGPFPA